MKGDTLSRPYFRRFMHWGYGAQKVLADLGIHGLGALSLVSRHTWAPMVSGRGGIFQSFALEASLAEGDVRVKPELRGWSSMYGLGRCSLKRCPECVAEDVATLGLAHWRIHHLWPFTHHCVIHESRLETRCAGCELPFVLCGEGVLPSDHCAACGSGKFKSDEMPWRIPPMAYWDLLKCMWQELTESQSIVQPSRKTVLESAIRLRMSGQSGDLLTLLMHDWGAASASELSHMLGGVRGLGSLSSSAKLPHVLITALAQSMERSHKAVTHRGLTKDPLSPMYTSSRSSVRQLSLF